MTNDSLSGGAEGSSSTNREVAICKRPGCGKPVPVTKRGRTRQFCSNECTRRYHNDARASARKPEPADGEDLLSGLETMLSKAIAHLRVAREQGAGADAAQMRAQLAEAEALRARAEADAATAAAALASAREDARAARAAAERYARERDAARAALIKRVPTGRTSIADSDYRELAQPCRQDPRHECAQDR